MEIIHAQLEQLPELAPLFDLYRQFYEQPQDLDLAANYLKARMTNGDNFVFLAREDDQAVGFTQLYPSFCSVAAQPILVLYDLYVRPSFRGQGVGEALMNRARDLARTRGVARLDLETAVDNHAAQALYEKLGYQRDTEFYKYSLDIG